MYYEHVRTAKDLWHKWRSSRSLILFIVFVALFLDNMLLTTVGAWSTFLVFAVLDDLVSVPIVPDYLYRLQQPNLAADETYQFLAKNCSNTEILQRRNYFVRHPAQFRRVLRTYCNWSVDWAMNKIEDENVQRTIILEKVASARRISERG